MGNLVPRHGNQGEVAGRACHTVWLLTCAKRAESTWLSTPVPQSSRGDLGGRRRELLVQCASDWPKATRWRARTGPMAGLAGAPSRPRRGYPRRPPDPPTLNLSPAGRPPAAGASRGSTRASARMAPGLVGQTIERVGPPPQHAPRSRCRTQGSGKVAVCTKCPNMPATGIWRPARTNAVAWRWPRHWIIGQMGTNRDLAGALLGDTGRHGDLENPDARGRAADDASLVRRQARRVPVARARIDCGSRHTRCSCSISKSAIHAETPLFPST
jgi:hypothetical protein